MPAAPRSFARSPRHAGLARFVECVFFAEGQPAHRLQRIVPSGRVQLLVNLAEDELRTVEFGRAKAGRAESGRAESGRAESEPVKRCGGLGVSGLYAESFVIESAMQRRIAGVAFRPGGAAPFFDVPIGALRGQHVDGEDVWGSFARTARDRLGACSGLAVLDGLERILLQRVKSFRFDPALRYAMGALEEGAPVSVVRERLGCSAGRLIAAFDRRVGLTPKRFARVRRFQRVLQAIDAGREGSWAGLALAHGYADQAHMIREFRRFSGVTPTRYEARPPAETGHLVVA